MFDGRVGLNGLLYPGHCHRGSQNRSNYCEPCNRYRCIKKHLNELNYYYCNYTPWYSYYYLLEKHLHFAFINQKTQIMIDIFYNLK